MYGRLSVKADHGITAVLIVAALTLFILAARSATERSFFLLLAFSASIVGGLRLWNPRQGPTAVHWVRSDVEVYEGETVDRRALSALGGRRGFLMPWQWTFAAPDEPALAKVFTGLRDAGVHFLSEGSHWGPAEVFEDLRARGLVSGTYRKQDEF